VLRKAELGYQIFDRAAGLPTSWAVDVAVVGRSVWVATLRHGLLRRGSDGLWAQVPALAGEWLLFVGPDAVGRGVWVGGQGGLYHVDGAGQVSGFTGLPHPNVHVVVERGGEVWIGTEGGLVRAPRSQLEASTPARAGPSRAPTSTRRPGRRHPR